MVLTKTVLRNFVHLTNGNYQPNLASYASDDIYKQPLIVAKTEHPRDKANFFNTNVSKTFSRSSNFW